MHKPIHYEDTWGILISKINVLLQLVYLFGGLLGFNTLTKIVGVFTLSMHYFHRSNYSVACSLCVNQYLTKILNVVTFLSTINALLQKIYLFDFWIFSFNAYLA